MYLLHYIYITISLLGKKKKLFAIFICKITNKSFKILYWTKTMQTEIQACELEMLFFQLVEGYFDASTTNNAQSSNANFSPTFTVHEFRVLKLIIFELSFWSIQLLWNVVWNWTLALGRPENFLFTMTFL